MAEETFWAENIADEVINRKSFKFSEEKIPKVKKWTVKSSSSISGVLHIGRLSDIVRGETAFRALEKKGFPVEFIYVTEDMDPLRKIPKGVPKEFEQYIGMPVSDVPDPEGCHKSYAEHFVEKFLSTFQNFLYADPTRFSMRKEYKKGSFNNEIIDLLRKAKDVASMIQGKQDTSLSPSWSPWKPICDKCGNLQTTVLKSFNEKEVEYVCRDYKFEKFTARGCGYEGKAKICKANGKLVWKSEWAAQWKRWNVCSEGAGKEYESSNSAFWVNAEICEKVLGFPSPVPIFYEHIMVDGKKMSASVGNVVYPHQWLEVARPETLKYLYMKRLNKARSFSWSEVPNLELELDRAFLSKDNKLVQYSAVRQRQLVEMPVDYSTIASLSQLFSKNDELIAKLAEMQLLPKKISKAQQTSVLERIDKARTWIERHAGEEFKLTFLEKVSERELNLMDNEAVPLFKGLIQKLKSLDSADEIQQAIFETAKSNNVFPKKLFKAIYLALTGKESGPRAGMLILALGKEKSIKRLKEIS